MVKNMLVFISASIVAVLSLVYLMFCFKVEPGHLGVAGEKVYPPGRYFSLRPMSMHSLETKKFTTKYATKLNKPEGPMRVFCLEVVYRANPEHIVVIHRSLGSNMPLKASLNLIVACLQSNSDSQAQDIEDKVKKLLHPTFPSIIEKITVTEIPRD